PAPLFSPRRGHGGVGTGLRRALASAFCALAIGSIAAKPLPVPFLSEYQIENWGIDDGYPENSCSGIVVAPGGYLWLSSFRGLIRFNGQDFKPWAPAAIPELRSTGIISMYQDSRQRTWFSTREGLVMNAGPMWKRWDEASGWPDRSDFVR